MPGDVRLRSGVEVELSSGVTIACDGVGASGAVTVLSHAHADHLVTGSAGPVVASAVTADLVAVRRDGADRPELREHPEVELLPAGHVAGSRAARITDPTTGRTYLYTGDICTRSRFYLDGFRPPAADVLIIESTYGRPGYEFPPHERIETDIVDWLTETMDRPVVLFGYALGRAQKLQRLAATADRTRILVTDAIAAINEVVERHLPVDFPATTVSEAVTLEAGDALVMPRRSAGQASVGDLGTGAGACTAGFSGWAVDSSFTHRGGYDVAFPLSDHCDHPELVRVVETVDPEVVYTHHGFADEFAAHLSRLGYRASSLKRNQTSLGEF